MTPEQLLRDWVVVLRGVADDVEALVQEHRDIREMEQKSKLHKIMQDFSTSMMIIGKDLIKIGF